MTEVRDSYARRILAQTPTKIDFVDDDGNVIHQAVANGKTNNFKIYTAWGIGSGSSTGGSTGGNTGAGGDDGGDPGGTTNPGHETVGDDVYPGDVNKGEVTKRFKLWQGPSNTNADTTVTFNQDLGENLNGLGDGLQAQLSMVETPYFDGKATKSKKIQITNGESGLNKFSTTSPVPISLKKGRLASKDTLKIELNGDGSKDTIYSSDIKEVDGFTTKLDLTVGSKKSYSFGAGFQNPPQNMVKTEVTSTGFIIERNSTQTETSNRRGTRLVVYKDGEKCATGPFDISAIQVEGLTPATVYKAGQFSVRYEDINGNPTSNTLPISQFTTKDVDNTVPDKLPSFLYGLVNWSNAGIFPSSNYPAVSNNVATIGSTGLVIEADNSDGYSLILLDENNQVVAKGLPGSRYLIYNGLQPERSYSGFKLAKVFTRPVIEGDIVVNPTVSFKFNDDGTMNINTAQGSIKDKDGNLISTFDVSVDYINSYTVQSEVSQLPVGSYLFVGNSTSASLAGVSKDFSNIGDGLEIYFEDPTWRNTFTSRLSSVNLSGVVRIPKKYILNGISTYSLIDGSFIKPAGSNYYAAATALGLTLNNGNVEVTGDLAFGNDEDYPTTAEEVISKVPKDLLRITYITTYKEGNNG